MREIASEMPLPIDECKYVDAPKVEIDVDVSDNFDYYHDSGLERKLREQYRITHSSHHNGENVKQQAGKIMDDSACFGCAHSDGMKSEGIAAKFRDDKGIANGVGDIGSSREKAVSDDYTGDCTIKKDDSHSTVFKSSHSDQGRFPKSNLQCPACFKSFKTKKLMKVHKVEVHGNHLYHCKLCDKWFPTRLKYDNHMNIHFNIRPYKCSECNRTFTSKKNRQRHSLNIHTVSDRKYACTQCPKRLKTRRHLESHLRMHNNDRAFKCSDCPKTYKYEAQLRIHRRLHSGERFYCKLCTRSFIDKADLKKHIVSHSDLRPYRCDTCGLTFKRKGALNSHILKHADLFNIAKAECRICGQTFRDLKLHMKTHDSHRPSFKCNSCGNIFVSKGNLSIHRKYACSHLEHLEHLCDICGKSFKSKTNLQKHRIQHTDGYKYPCKKCDRSFALYWQLHRHIRRAHDKTDERRGTKCKLCSCFVLNMDKHIQKQHHSKLECSTCGRKFNQKHNLKLHENRHLNVKEFRCDHCQKLFMMKGDVKRHIQCRHMVKGSPLQAA